MTALTCVVVLMFPLWPQSAEEQQVDRRGQARDAYRATPEGLYRHFCAHCHGDDAKGGGRLWAAELSPAPPDISALGRPASEIETAITSGSAARGRSALCPPWARTLTPTEIARLARWLAALGAESRPPSADDSPPAAGSAEQVPWLLLALVLGEIAGLCWIWRRRFGRSATHPRSAEAGRLPGSSAVSDLRAPEGDGRSPSSTTNR